MPKAPALAKRRLIEDSGHTAHEGVVIDGFPDLNALLFGFTNEIPNTRFDLMIPPMVITRDWKNSEILPLGVERIL